MWPYFENHQGGPGHWELVSCTKALCKSKGRTLPETWDYSAEQSYYYPRCTASSHSSVSTQGHQGITKVKQHLRQRVWWTGIDIQAERYLRECLGCQIVGPTPPPEPLQMTDTSKQVWLTVHVDYYGPFPSGESLCRCWWNIKVAQGPHHTLKFGSHSHSTPYPNVCNTWYSWSHYIWQCPFRVRGVYRMV